MSSELIKLSKEQQARFEILERICIAGRVVYFMVGMSLAEIKANPDMYRSKGFLTMEEYGMSIGYHKDYINKLIAAAEVAMTLPDNLRNFLGSERAARALGNIPSSLRVEVMLKATAGATKQATEPAIKRAGPPPPPAAKKKSSPPPQPKKALPKKPNTAVFSDKTGLEIPKEVEHVWKMRDEITQLLTDISIVRTKFRRARETNHILFAEVDFTEVEAMMSRVNTEANLAMPYAVCPQCNGKLDISDCTVCKGRGFISKFYWDVKIPQETKTITGRK